MRLSRVEIRNFRSIRHVVVDLGRTTVFVGPNNAGKTAILGAACAAELEGEQVVTALGSQKTTYAAALSNVLRTNPDLAQRTLPTFRWTIERLPGLT